MQKLYLIPLLFFCFIFCNLKAQDPSSIDVKALSDQQIGKVVTEVNSRGLTIDQAAQMKGASPLQVEQLKQRMQEMNLSKADSSPSIGVQKQQATRTVKKLFSEKEPVSATSKTKRIFGFQLFNTKNLTFEPPVNMPTPQNYVLGIDDELSISVWGASQKNYRLRVETSGALLIPDIGPVYVSGMELSKAKDLITKRLISIYQGMDGANPNTYADISISNLRSININVIGDALVPGTYTLPSTASAFNALYLSGGPNENGSFRNIQVMRNNKVIKTIDVYDYLMNANAESNIQLREQDVIYIPTYQKRVEATGAFKRNGIFELTEKEKLSDLIRYLGGFTDAAFKAQLSLTRKTEKEKKIIDITKSIFESFTPENGDSIVASEIINRYENRVNISGAVFRPGTYELTEGLTLSGLIKKAQGVTESYFSNRGLIIRLQENLVPMNLSFNVDEALNGTNDITLHREDRVIIQNIFSMRQKRTIQIFGEVQKPGEFDFSDNMTLKDLIFKADGFKEAASESFIELSRRHNYSEANKVSDEIVKLYQFNIDRKLILDSKGESFLLQPFDYIYVRKAPSYNEQRTVVITGEVRYPGAYSIGSKNERISELINRAGGLMPNAFVDGARLRRSNLQAARTIEILGNRSADTLLTKLEKQLTGEALELRLGTILKNPESQFNYLLSEGDEIIIPETTQEVGISGEIQNPIGLAYEKGKGLKYYIDRSGGFTEKARKGKVFVIYSNGTTQVTHNFLWHRFPVIEPGSQIIIPKKPSRQNLDNSSKWLGIASAFSTLMIAIITITKL